MRIVDLSHDLAPEMPLYPGTMAPRFKETATIDSDGYREKRISLCVHSGTHVDAPAHIIKGAATLDQLPVQTYWGQASLVDVSLTGKLAITLDDLLLHADAIGRYPFLLLHTGWSRYWGSESYFSGFPALTPEAALFLVDAGVNGVGLDTPSADAMDARGLPIHHILLGAGMIVVENLTNLEGLPETGFSFACLPLKIRDADGSPVRAVAILP